MVVGAMLRGRVEWPPLRGLSRLGCQRVAHRGDEHVRDAEGVDLASCRIGLGHAVHQRGVRVGEAGVEPGLFAQFATSSGHRVLTGRRPTAGRKPGAASWMLHEEGVRGCVVDHPRPCDQFTHRIRGRARAEQVECVALHGGLVGDERGKSDQVGVADGFPGMRRGTGRNRCPFSELLVAQSLMLGSMNSLVTMSSGVRPSLGVAPWAT